MPTFRHTRNSIAGRQAQAIAGSNTDIPTPPPPIYEMTFGDAADPMHWGDPTQPMEW